MDGYNLYPPAQDFATGGQSLAVKGGVAGGLLFLLLAFIIYVFLKSRNCSMNCDMKVGDASGRPVEEA
jgi:mannose/fructose/N-acetylgalactosamine-specific phosphotransferase system component IID